MTRKILTQLVQPDGSCQLCGESHPRKAIIDHLSSCLDRAAADAAKPTDVLHVEAESYNRATGVLYWLHAAVRTNAKLTDLDAFLRKTWMEPCCGHMSAFTAHGMRFEHEPEDPEVADMTNATLADIVEPGEDLDYEYDFGSTTQVALCVVSRRKGIIEGRGKVVPLARNEPPAIRCACGKWATSVCSIGCAASNAAVCRVCAPDHSCGEDMLSPIVASPRTGTCGYPTLRLRPTMGRLAP